MTPYILSVSRREDIPAFKPEWFLEVLKNGKITLNNFYKEYEINFEKLKFIVFWTKNPEPIIKYLELIPYQYYFQYTLNYYPEYELNVPPLKDRLETFKKLSDLIGKDKVIWRFDPIIINDNINKNKVLNRIKHIGDQIFPYTEKLVFSFVDPYKKLSDDFKEIDLDTKINISENIIKLNENWNLQLATCAEGININGIEHNRCIDPNLIRKIVGEQKWIKDTKDKSQRLECGCMISSDIGKFKSCKHNCTYCYAK